MSTLKETRRRSDGNMLALVAVITVCLLVALLFFGLNLLNYFGGSGQHATAVEAASLAAAGDISKIVIEDRSFGFVALSDYPSIGQGTLAGDGQPLPVIGINTLIGTARLDMLIAHDIGDPNLIELARKDSQHAREAAAALVQEIQRALSGQGQLAKNMDGQPVDVYKRAEDVYKQNVIKTIGGGKPIVNSFKLTLGWLDNGGDTLTDIPRPTEKAEVPPEKQKNGKYEAFVDIPAHGENFTFAAVSNRAALVDRHHFRPADTIKVSSIVLVEASHTIEEVGGTDHTGATAGRTALVNSSACAQAFAQDDTSPPAHLSVAFPGGYVPGITRLRDLFINDQLKTRLVRYYKPIGGDWPTDPGTNLTPGSTPVGNPSTVSQMWSVGFYDWLRANHLRPRIDKINEMLDQPFEAMSGAPAFAGAASTVTTYAFSGCPDDNSDPRILAIAQQSPQAASAYMLMTTLDSIFNQVPANATAMQSTAGNLTFVGGAPATQGLLKDLWDDLALSNKSAWQTYNSAQAVLADTTISPELKFHAQVASNNASWIIDQTNYFAANFKTLTSDKVSYASNGSAKKWTLDALSSLPGNRGNHGNDVFPVYRGISETDLRAASTAAQSSMSSTVVGGFGATNSYDNYSWIETAVSSGVVPSGPRSNGSFWFAGTDPGSGYNYGAVAPPPPTPPPASATNPLTNRIFRYVLQQDGSVTQVFGQSPFANLPISENQLYGLGLNAMTTGTETPITWTAVLRDEARLLGRPTGGKHAGQPLAGIPINFAQLAAFGGTAAASPLSVIAGQIASGGVVLNPQPRDNFVSGGLAVEFQLRTPLILECAEEPPADQSSTTNASGGTTTLVPDIPAGLL